MLKFVRTKLAREYGIHLYRDPNEYHLELDYPVSDSPRYGYKVPQHRIIEEDLEARRDVFEGYLASLTKLAPLIDRIPYAAVDDRSPYWDNIWFPPHDGVAIMHFVSAQDPKNFVEIGSGNSTKFARHAIEHRGLRTRITSIDPQPRAEVDTLCDELIRAPLEDADLSVFARLEEGDILSFDGSHRCFTDSDVTVFFLEVLPKLAAGVIVHVHDIFWPKDYPPSWGHRYYNEQYLLGQLLLLARERIDILLANAFIDQDPRLSDLARRALSLDDARLASFEGMGAAGFWLRLNQRLR